MAMFGQNTDLKERQLLDAKNIELADKREVQRVLNANLKDSFTKDGAITRQGLEAELLRLDVVRRDTNALDQCEQSLIQGQQSEILKLLAMEKTMLTRKETILETITELESQIQPLRESVQRRSNNDAT